jgi:hypothetical protein
VLELVRQVAIQFVHRLLRPRILGPDFLRSSFLCLELVGKVRKAVLAGSHSACSALTADLFDKLCVVVDVAIKGIEWWASGPLLAHNISFDPPWEHREALVPHVSAGGHCKNVIKFFESSLLRLGHPEEDHH